MSNENNTPETTDSATNGKAGFLKNRNVRIALAVTTVAGVAFVAYKLKSSSAAESAVEVVEAVAS